MKKTVICILTFLIVLFFCSCEIMPPTTEYVNLKLISGANKIERKIEKGTNYTIPYESNYNHVLEKIVDGEGKEYNAGDSIVLNKDTTLTWFWKRLWTISVNDGITYHPTSKTFKDGENYTIQPLERPHYKIKAITDDKGKTYSVGDVIKITSDMTFSYYWEYVTLSYSVTLISNEETSTTIYTEGTYFEIPSKCIENKVLVNISCSNGETYNPGDHITLYSDLTFTYNWRDKTIEDDYIYEIKDEEVSIIDYVGEDTDITILSEIQGYPVTKLSIYAFKNNNHLHSVTIPQTIRYVDTWAFYGWNSTQKIIVASGCDISKWNDNWNNNNAQTILEDANFDGYTYSVSGSEIFLRGTKALAGDIIAPSAKVNGCTIHIAPYCYSNSPSINSVTIPNDIGRVGQYAFSDMDISQIIYIMPGTNISNWYPYWIAGCNAEIQYMDIPEDADYKLTYSIQDHGWVYQYKGSSNDVIIPSTSFHGLNIKSICSFEGNKNVIKITIPDNIKTLSIGCFKDCTNLQEVRLSSTLKSLPSDLFNNCTQLKTLVIPEGIDTIAKNAFYRCINLKNITIPSTVKNIEDGAFRFCNALDNIVLDKENISFSTDGSSLIDVKNHKLIKGSLTNTIIPNDGTINSLGNSAFENYINLTSIVIPDTITIIPDYCFSGCINLNEINISPNIKSIGRDAFNNCNSLHTIEIPQRVVIIGVGAFANCPIDEIFLHNQIKNVGTAAFLNWKPNQKIYIELDTDDSQWSYYWDNSCNAQIYKGAARNCDFLTVKSFDDYLIYAYIGNETEITVPSNINGHIINGINYGAFEALPIKSVILPDTIEIIYGNAFKDCSALSHITLGNNLKTIDQKAFYYCTNLSEIELPEGLTTINDEAFSNCTSLRSIVIPNSVTNLGKQTFFYCSSLTDAKIGTGVTQLDGTFFYCFKLSKVELTDSIEIIKDRTFEDCALTEINLPSNLKQIGNYAFMDCNNLITISLPDTTFSIGQSAFHNCDSLTNINLNKVTQILDGAFSDCAKIASITIPNTVNYIGYYAFGHWTKKQQINVEANEHIIHWNSKWNYDTKAIINYL